MLNGTRAVSTLFASNPRGALLRFANERSISPAATSGTMDNATSATTSARCSRRAPPADTGTRVARSRLSGSRHTLETGTRLHAIAAAIERAIATSATRGLMAIAARAEDALAAATR